MTEPQSPLKRRMRANSSPTEVEELTDVEETPAAMVQSDRDFYSNFTLLVVLYMLQGIPLGLAGGTLPYLLKVYAAVTRHVAFF